MVLNQLTQVILCGRSEPNRCSLSRLVLIIGTYAYPKGELNHNFEFPDNLVRHIGYWKFCVCDGATAGEGVALKEKCLYFS